MYFSKRYPPYTDFNISYLLQLIKYRGSLFPKHLCSFALFSAGVITGGLILHFDLLQNAYKYLFDS